jgi:hypothetical protein
MGGRAALPPDPSVAVFPDSSGKSTPPSRPLTPPASARAAIPRTSNRPPGYNSSANRTAHIAFPSQRLSVIPASPQQHARCSLLAAPGEFPVRINQALTSDCLAILEQASVFAPAHSSGSFIEMPEPRRPTCGHQIDGRLAPSLLRSPCEGRFHWCHELRFTSSRVP